MSSTTEDVVEVFVKWITTKDGKRLYASDHNLKAFRLLIPSSKYRPR